MANHRCKTAKITEGKVVNEVGSLPISPWMMTLIGCIVAYNTIAFTLYRITSHGRVQVSSS
jgi:hypothetical protein